MFTSMQHSPSGCKQIHSALLIIASRPFSWFHGAFSPFSSHLLLSPVKGSYGNFFSKEFPVHTFSRYRETQPLVEFTPPIALFCSPQTHRGNISMVPSWCLRFGVVWIILCSVNIFRFVAWNLTKDRSESDPNCLSWEPYITYLHDIHYATESADHLCLFFIID